MEDCSCSHCLRKIFKTVKVNQSINFPRTYKTDYKEQYNLKLQSDSLKFKIKPYKPQDRFILLESQYKSSFKNLQGRIEFPIKHNQNLQVSDYAQLDGTSTYKRSFRSQTLHEKTEPIIPLNVITQMSIPMSGTKSIYQQSYTQKKLQNTEKIYQQSQRHINNDSWNNQIQSQYRYTHKGDKGEMSLKLKPLQNQIFILNYEKKASSRYQQDFTDQGIQCKNAQF